MKRLLHFTGLPRSGGSLAARLVDGHPQVLSYPFEVGFGPRGSFVVNPAARTVGDLLQATGRAGDFFDFFTGINAKGLVHNLFDRQAFENLLAEPAPPDPDAVAMVNLISEAFFKSAASLAPQWDAARIIAWHASGHNLGQLDRLMAATQDVLVVHIIRSPYDTINSFLNMKKTRRRHVDVTTEALYWVDMALKGLVLADKYPERYQLLRYEDMVGRPESLGQIVCRLTGLPEDPILVHPTICGQGWKANSSFQKHSTVSNKSVGRFARTMDAADVTAIEQACGHMLQVMGYLKQAPFVTPAMEPYRPTTTDFMDLTSALRYRQVHQESLNVRVRMAVKKQLLKLNGARK